MKTWQYTDQANLVVSRTLPDGRGESCLVTREDVQAWIADGNTPDPAPTLPAPPTAREAFDARLDGDPTLKALVDELEVLSPGYRGRARGRL